MVRRRAAEVAERSREEELAVASMDGGRRRDGVKLLQVGDASRWPARLAAAAAMVMEGVEKIRVRVSFWEMVTWQDLIGQFGEWRIMTRVSLCLANFIRWGLPHGMIWLSGV